MVTKEMASTEMALHYSDNMRYSLFKKKNSEKKNQHGPQMGKVLVGMGRIVSNI